MDTAQSGMQMKEPMLETGSMARDMGREGSFVQVEKHMKENGKNGQKMDESLQILEL
jgi:hypothetical protein